MNMFAKVGTILCSLFLVPAGVMACSSANSPTPSQTPISPTPISPVSEDITWNIGDTTVAATITRPNDKAVHPAVVFVAGSGPTDRNWNSTLLPGTNGSAALLADELARAGFVTIRYDKRVTGPYAQQDIPLLIGKISMASHLDELSGAVDQLVARTDVNPSQIFVVANSEGTLHALNYQVEKNLKFAGLVLLAPPGRNMADLMRGQIEAQLVGMPSASEIMAGYDKLMANFLADKPFAADPLLPEGINNLFQGLYVPVNLPFARELFVIDPTVLLKKVSAPTLVVIGKKDIQVDWQLDGAPLEEAARTLQNVSFIYPENANHIFKNEPRPRSALTAADSLTYNAADRVLDVDALISLKGWLASRVAK